MNKITTSFVLLILLSSITWGTIIHVPSQYAQIQLAISAANPSDTVLVADGIYTGPNNKDIDFLGKAITVMSENGPENCIIDCEENGRGFYFHQDEDNQSILSGFTITNGNSAASGGGISIFSSSPAITNCIITGNSCAYNGGGIYAGYGYSGPVISGCTISDNLATFNGGGISISGPCRLTDCEIIGNNANAEGGGIEIDQCSPTISFCTISDNISMGEEDKGGGGTVIYKGTPVISFCLFSGNSAASYGGGLLLSDADPYIINCTISRNSADLGGGIFFEVYYSATTTLLNTIVEGNLGECGLYFQWPPDAEISYCDFFNNQLGNFNNPPNGVGSLVSVNANGDSCDIFSNILLDPIFFDPVLGNFHLQEESPCIDAGDPNSTLDPDSTIADMGVFYYDQSMGTKSTVKDDFPIDFGIKAYPNPFNQSTVISYELQAISYLELTVYDINGREITNLVKGYQNSGNHEVVFDAKCLVSGVYFVRLESGNFKHTQKLILMK